MKYYVYILIDDNIPFYVGKGTTDRMFDHVKNARTKVKSPVLNKIRSMLKCDKRITYHKFFETDNELLALEKEILLIKEIGRRDLKTGTLLNLTAGGEGVINYNWTNKHRENLSAAIKNAIKEGRFSPGTNFTRTKEYKIKLSKSGKKYWKTKEGKKRKIKISKEKREKLVNGKRILSDIARKKMSDGAKLINSKRGLKEKEQISDKLKKYWKSEKGLLRKQNMKK